MLESLPFPFWEGFLRLLGALMLGSLIGLEREKRRQPAGFRTHAVLALGSSLMGLLSLHVAYAYAGTDPSRIASQVITGIGFLGAGAIIRFGVSIKGLTTAASLWTTAGIGLSVGMGLYLLSLLTTLILLFTLSLMSRFEKEFLSSGGRYMLHISMHPIENPLEYVKNISNKLKITKIGKTEGLMSLTLELTATEEELDHILEVLVKDPRVSDVELL
ncbi:MAG: MgtC/SapB family protein [Aquificaceae bacterium]|nr:MgtC/SapB family protein [Aquificaceae bacterium]MDW8424170.1 MgtC/SapB family protein [Aquificaceae bacterium]